MSEPITKAGRRNKVELARLKSVERRKAERIKGEKKIKPIKGEIFKEIIGFPDYKISSFGRVISLKRNREMVLKLSQCNSGYYIVTIRNEYGQSKGKRVHSLVVNAFILDNYIEKGFVCDHINNIKTDNCLSNLQAISQRENTSKDKVNKTSKYTGVSWVKSSKKWNVSVRINDKVKALGLFKNEKVAAGVYQYAIEMIEKQQPIIIGAKTTHTKRTGKQELKYRQQIWIRAQKSQAKISLPADQMKRLEAHSKSTGLSKSVLIHLLLNASKSYNTVMSKHLNK